MRNNEERLGAPMQRQDATPPLQQQLNQQAMPLPNVSATPLNFVTPTEFVPLPSKGKFYPQHHPLHGKDVVEIKQMTAKEEDILTSRSLLKKGVALDRLIQSLIVDQSINPDTLTIEDRSAVIIAARISAYGAEYTTSVTCPECGEKNKSSFNLLEKLEHVESEGAEEIQVNEDGTFVVLLPSTKWVLTCRALSGYDEKAFAKLGDKKKEGSDALLMEQLKAMTVTVQNVVDREMIEKALTVLPAGDSRYLRKVYSQIVKGVDMRHTFQCSSCEESTVMEVPLTADFFWFK